MQPLTVIVNPIAAKGRAVRTAEHLEQCLKMRGVDYIIKKTEYSGHATELAMEAAKQKKNASAGFGR